MGEWQGVLKLLVWAGFALFRHICPNIWSIMVKTLEQKKKHLIHPVLLEYDGIRTISEWMTDTVTHPLAEPFSYIRMWGDSNSLWVNDWYGDTSSCWSFLRASPVFIGFWQEGFDLAWSKSRGWGLFLICPIFLSLPVYGRWLYMAEIFLTGLLNIISYKQKTTCWYDQNMWTYKLFFISER